jgi:hypothetical protein
MYFLHFGGKEAKTRHDVNQSQLLSEKRSIHIQQKFYILKGNLIPRLLKERNVTKCEMHSYALNYSQFREKYERHTFEI